MSTIPGPAGLYKLFYVITGAGLVTLFLGFGKCLFDLDQISECADHAEYAFDIFKAFGDHVIAWFIAMFEEIMSRQG